MATVTAAVALEILASRWLSSHGVAIAITIAVAVALSVAARLIVRRLVHKVASLDDPAAESGLRRTATVTHTLTSAFLAAIWVIAILIVLGEFDLNLAPLIAGAGIVGVALGFGAQSLVRDGLSGFFILLENQFGLGDTVEVSTPAGTVSGRVETLTLRVTSIRQYDGTLSYVPNGNIQVAANKSRGWARAIVDVRVAYGEDVEHIRAILGGLFDDLRERELKGPLRSGPEVLGVQTLAADALVLRVIADAAPGSSAEVERVLRERIAARLTAEGVRVAPG